MKRKVYVGMDVHKKTIQLREFNEQYEGKGEGTANQA